MPYAPAEAHSKTRKANTAGRSRQWVAVYESSMERGDDEGTAITKANGVVKKNWEGTNPARRKPTDHRPAEMKMAASAKTLVKAPGIGGQAKVLSSTRRPSSKVTAAPQVKVGPQMYGAPKQAALSDVAVALQFGKHASTTVVDKAKELVDPENPPGRVGRWKSMIDRLTGRAPEKVAAKMTSSTRLKGLRGSKKVPTVQASEVKDLGKHMTSETRRMQGEAGKSPVVSKKKLWRKHTRAGGRIEDVQRSFEASRTFTAAPTGDQPGTRTVQFKDKPSGSSSATKSKAKRALTRKK